jgi:hypothetical protein
MQPDNSGHICAGRAPQTHERIDLESGVWHFSANVVKQDQGPTIIRGDETTDVAPVGEQQAHHASATLQEE